MSECSLIIKQYRMFDLDEYDYIFRITPYIDTVRFILQVIRAQCTNTPSLPTMID